jgi:hypothetical protein
MARVVAANVSSIFELLGSAPFRSREVLVDVLLSQPSFALGFGANTIPAMLTLYSYPTLFGVADNNGYGLKVRAFLKLAGVPFIHEHIFDAAAAPRGQLPYIVDDGEPIGDSEAIIAHLENLHVRSSGES